MATNISERHVAGDSFAEGDWPDELLLSAFADLTLPPSVFNHRAHLRVAWLLIKKYGRDEAEIRMCRQLKRFAAHVGTANKYHCTLTAALMRLIAFAAQEHSMETWPIFLARNQALLHDMHSVVARHYSPELLCTDSARTEFIPPDRAPLPQ